MNLVIIIVYLLHVEGTHKNMNHRSAFADNECPNTLIFQLSHPQPIKLISNLPMNQKKNSEL